MHDLHSLLLIPDKLSTRFDSEVDINIKLSITFILHVVVLFLFFLQLLSFLQLSSFSSSLPLTTSFLIGTEKVIS